MKKSLAITVILISAMMLQGCTLRAYSDASKVAKALIKEAYNTNNDQSSKEDAPSDEEINDAKAEDLAENEDIQSDGDLEAEDEVTDTVDEKTGAGNASDADGDSKSKDTYPDGADTNGIVNNHSYFVGKNDKVYFRAHSAKALKKVSLFDGFLDIDCGESSLYCYDLKTDELTELCTVSNAYKEMFICNDDLLVTSSGKEGNEDIFAYSLMHREPEDSANRDVERFIGVSDDGHYMITYDFAYGDEHAYIHIYDDRDNCTRDYMEESFAGYIGMKDENLFYFYFKYDDPEDIMGSGYYGIKQMNMKNGVVTDLGRFEVNEYGNEVQQVLFDDDNMYFTYGVYGGTGHFYQGGYLVSAIISERDSVKCEPITEDENAFFDKCPVYSIKDDSLSPIDGIPYTTAFKEGSELGFFDGDGNYVPVKKMDSWATHEEDESVTSVETSAYLYGKIFLVRDYLERVKSEDIGWREAYRRSGYDVVMIDCETGREKIILSQPAK